MTIREALAYIHAVDWRRSKPGLRRIHELLEKLGHPERTVRFVHVTGTNGKGSTCAMLASILQAAGYRTGLYTSPYIFRFNERMQVNGQEIPDEELCAITEEVRPLADSMADHPSEFEIVTAIAFTWFARRKCDIVVCEVGMGGEFDATNVIGAPEAAVLCNIGLDHTEVLGDTLEKIAATKSGIIKPGCDACCTAPPMAWKPWWSSAAARLAQRSTRWTLPGCTCGSTRWRDRSSTSAAGRDCTSPCWASISFTTPP